MRPISELASRRQEDPVCMGSQSHGVTGSQGRRREGSGFRCNNHSDWFDLGRNFLSKKLMAQPCIIT